MAEQHVVNMDDMSQKNMLLTLIRGLSGNYRFEWARFRPRRTDPQNRYFHGVVLPIIGDAVRALGNDYSNDEVKEWLKGRFLKQQRVFVNAKGELETEDVVRKTSKLDTVEFNEFIEYCCHFAAESLNTHIPEPSFSR